MKKLGMKSLTGYREPELVYKVFVLAIVFIGF